VAKRTYASVTEIPCTCGYLDNNAQDPFSSIVFDETTNEYHFEFQHPSGARVSVVIFHCPFCGGAAPESKRPELFASLSSEEKLRLECTVQEIRTLKDVERTLGKPDIEKAIFFPTELGSLRDRATVGEREPIRTLIFTQKSDVANIHVTVYSNDEVETAIIGKLRDIVAD
jgi:hypothetical protein